ncbi:ABC transporter ATP-binding protein [Accumulibacter sp.]|uniref:ABC transporter ATP-binding protein n=1 Tax=Accumulibacter sp. TaxID=2053492 RepID=UPI001A4B54B7|nr:ABC transporter ATP-binding protein [Accumulibacter sp.]MBL8373211.1 ABC transporter ATP-binding protein [Accumulibacter sp.]
MTTQPPGRKATASSKLRLVMDLLGPYRRWVMVILAAMLVETAMSLAGPWPLKIILDNVVGNHKPPGWLDALRFIDLAGDKMELAAVAGVAVLVIALLGALASYIDNYYTESVSQWVAHDLRMRVYDHLQRLSLGYYDTHQTGSILSTLTADIKTIQGFASSGTLGILVDLLTIVGMLGIMFWLDWDFALIAIGVTPFLLLFVARFNREVKDATHEVRRYQSDIVAVVQQGLESIRIVKAFGRQELEENQLAKVSHATVDAALAARRVKSLLSPAVSITVAGCTGYVLWRGTGLVMQDVMTVGALTVFLAYLGKFFKPVQDLAKMSNSMAQTAVAIERIQLILDTDDILPEKPGATDPGKLRGEIAFDHVAFSYNAEAKVLSDVVFRIAPGQTVGVVGPTGSGKSTVVSMIPRFYDPTGGVVWIDGVDVRDYDLQALRRQIGFVLQDTALFHGTIRENIAYGRPDATDAEIAEAARLANADEFISRMAHGYDTMVGERGMTLSGGQRQRIGIARAVIRDAPILILDEPTAALDTESEKLVMDALQRLMKGRTVITIAHRLSTIRDADKIIVVKGGVVAEEGSHEELVARGGVYAELYRTQIQPASPTGA